jgi:Uncharacterized protein conserved in bacteria (DUF2184)
MQMQTITSRPLKLTNSRGELIKLTPQENYHVRQIQNQMNEACKRFQNSLGYEINITSLTTIMKKISEQKFFEIAPADYLPVRVGEGAWSSNLVTYRSFELSGNFEEGIVNLGSNNARLATSDAGIDSLSIQVFNWAKSLGWSIMDLEQAAKAGNWDIVTSKERARKKNWDLGIQKIAFLGANSTQGSSCLGLLNQQGGVTTLASPSWFTVPISNMTTAQLKTFTASIIESYRNNCNRTAWPTHLIVPESDYNGMASQASADFPIKSTLQLLEETFQTICRNKNFKILPLAYADGPYGIYQGLSPSSQLQIYTLLNYDEESIRMDIPVDYTNTLANSVDNFMFNNVGYGQFTGVLAYRPLELMYITIPTPVPFV